MSKRNSFAILIYPIILAIVPFLYLYNHNIMRVQFTDIVRLMLIIVLTEIAIIMIANLFIKDRRKTSFLIGILTILFFSYGHIFGFLSDYLPEIRNRNVLILFSIATLVLILIVLRSKKFNEITNFFIIFSFTLIGIQFLLITNYQIRKQIFNSAIKLELLSDPLIFNGEELPDIYFIILDAHTSPDVLKNKFDYDSSETIDSLVAAGFYFANCSQTNYTGTPLSLAASFSMNYLPDSILNKEGYPDFKNLIVPKFLENLGYQKIRFESKAEINTDFGEDIYLVREKNFDSTFNIFPFTKMNSFESEMIKTTLLQPILKFFVEISDNFPENVILDVESAVFYENYYQVKYIVETLGDIPLIETDGPKFVYAHLLVPHEPFIFNPDGSYLFHHGYDEVKVGYANNSEFIDMQLPGIVNKIISQSKIPPIIIIQGDHGRNGGRPDVILPIINLMYLPGGGDENLYRSISPVNTFRVIFNHYFETDYELLDDISYYVRYDTVHENFCTLND